MFKRKRKIALILSLAMVFAAFGCIGTVAETSENLIPNGSFEDYTGNTLAQWSYQTSDAVVKTEEGAAYHGNAYVNLWADKYSRIETTVPAKEKTTYLLSFYYKASMVDSGRVNIEYKKDTQGVYAYMEENGLGGDATMDGTHFEFGSQQSVDALTWKKAEFPFTTSIYTNTIVLKIGGIEGYRDESLSIDNFSLTEVEGAPNLIPGGSFEYSLDSENDQKIPFVWNKEYPHDDYSKLTLFKDDTGVLLPVGEHCLKTIPSADLSYKQIEWYKNTIFLMEGNYKLTFRYMMEKVGEPADPTYAFLPTIGFRTVDNIKPHTDWSYYVYCAAPENEMTWYDYTIYFRVPEGAAAKGYKFTIELAYPGTSYGVRYYDDFVLTYDETDVEFGKGYIGSSQTLMQQPQMFNFVTTINNTEAADEVEVRAHYVPKSETDGGYSLISCVYEYDETANTKKLHTIEIANSDPTMNGKISTLVDTVTVPKAAEGVSYKVEAFLWNSVSGLTPVGHTSAVLTE
ncbi:MAG: hypothetical protein E7408_06010 [Ruminococcaceae bacterium]|nr:hypothetical protein [Oscillospiraceae bacterium]